MLLLPDQALKNNVLNVTDILTKIILLWTFRLKPFYFEMVNRFFVSYELIKCVKQFTKTSVKIKYQRCLQQS